MLDLRQPDARAALLRVVKGADVFVHAMRNDAIERLGLDYGAVRQARPDIVYCAAYGYTKTGPYAKEPAYDDMIQGMCGMAAMNALLAGEPRFTPTVIGDKVAGLTVVYSILAALFHRARTGEGQAIEVPMFETLVSFVMAEHLWERAFDERGALGYPRVMSQLRKPHRTTDGYVCMLPYTDRNWKDFFELAGRAEMAADPRYATPSARSQNYETLYTLLGELIAARSTGWWLERCRALSIPVAPVNDLERLFADPHLSAVGAFFPFEHPHLGTITQVRPPVNFSVTPSDVRIGAPRLGEHSREVLAAAGLSAREIDALAAAGATV
jgi:formyl-CoA transferase